MKKALLLGAMAFFAINLATVQTSNAQGLVKGQKSADEQKIEKEKNQFQTASSATTVNPSEAKRTDAKEGTNVTDPKLTTETNSISKKGVSVETTSKSQSHRRLKANEMSRVTSTPNAMKKAASQNAMTDNDPAKKVVRKNAEAASVNDNAPKASNLKPKRPVDVKSAKNSTNKPVEK